LDLCLDICSASGKFQRFEICCASVVACSQWVLLPPQTAVVSAPLFVILIDLSTNGRYIGIVLMLFMHTFSAVVLIMLPKVLSYYGVHTGSGNVGRGNRAGTRISGLELKDPPVDAAVETRMKFGDDAVVCNGGGEG
jgi:hypothetical protein